MRISDWSSDVCSSDLREEECDLLVMGNRGASAEFAIAHLGSKLERVIRASTKPILIAPSDIGDIKKVLLAYDGGTSANRALELMEIGRASCGARVGRAVSITGGAMDLNKKKNEQ